MKIPILYPNAEKKVCAAVYDGKQNQRTNVLHVPWVFTVSQGDVVSFQKPPKNFVFNS